MNRARNLTPCEVAGLWGCSTKTVLRLIRAGELPAVRLSRKTIFVSEVDAAAFYATRSTHLSSIGSIAAGAGRPWGS